MAWPTGTVPTTNVDAGTDDPSQARADIKTAFDKLNEAIGARGIASGVASLDGSGRVPSGELALALLLVGGTMTGKITLDGDPTANLHASTKQYVDNSVAASSPFASGTVMLFRQTSAPTGWTKNSSFNEYALRVTSGTVGSGGADNFTSVFGTGKATASHVLTTGEIPAHDHGSVANHVHQENVSDNQDPSTVIAAQYITSAGGSTNAKTVFATTAISGARAPAALNTAAAGGHTHSSFGGGGGHTHTINTQNLKYVDIILASKD